ncbi:YihY/virulence factor BrkB family protein [Flavobacteriaceae bacterium]|jgi:membrane protein|nr:YihY/virulence factor BrkB family protein [Flavobacteriaceae bacterium]
MSKSIEQKIEKIPVLRWVLRFLKSIKLPGLEGLSLYDLFEMYVLGIIHGALTIRASAVAFSFFMAIFPFLLFIIILIPYIPFEGFQSDFLNFLEASLPPNTSDFFNQNIFENINKNRGGGLISSVFLISMFLMSNGVNAVFSSFENSYHQQLNRNFINQYLYAFGVSIILVVILIITIIGIGFSEIYLIHPLYDSLNIEDASTELFWIDNSKFLFFVLMIYLIVAVLYFFGTKEGKQSRFFSVGALFTTLLVLLNSYVFGFYIENFSNYNQLYGSIGALLILLFYLWLNAIILLLGFELNASLQRLKQKCNS